MPFVVSAQDGAPTAIRVTHGPILGRPAPDSMSLWVRTNRPGEVRIWYGGNPKKLERVSDPVTTAVEHDNTGVITLKGLKPNTVYHYRVEDHQQSGSFRTLPRADDFKDAENNPKGLFNFRFEFACGNNQSASGNSNGPHLPGYDTLNREVRDKVNFAILNGDWLYEDRREYTAGEWIQQVGLPGLDQAPRIVRKAPTIAGVWENYKIYLTRGRNLSKWHRHVPSFLHGGRSRITQRHLRNG